MKRLGNAHVRPDVRPFTGGDGGLVRLALGADLYVMTDAEAVDLAAAIVAAVDAARKRGGGRGDGQR